MARISRHLGQVLGTEQDNLKGPSHVDVRSDALREVQAIQKLLAMPSSWSTKGLRHQTLSPNLTTSKTQSQESRFYLPAGRGSQDGKVVLVSVGISNTTMESQTLAKLAAADARVNPHFVFLDGAQGAQAAGQAANASSDY